MIPRNEVRRRLLTDAILIAEEQKRRRDRGRCLGDLRFFTELLYPPDDDSFSEFWKRLDEPQEWLLKLCLQWKRREPIEILPGFELIIEGKGRRIEKPEEVDLSEYITLLILQSRETLKTAIRRIDFAHDLAFWPMVRGIPAANAWFAHKLPEAVRNNEAIKSAMCASDPFNNVWGGILVPEHRDPEKWGTQEKFNTPIHRRGLPEPSATFLAVKARYEGGRYRGGHFDDLVTGEDRDSAAVRESKKTNLKDRENERDRTVGIRTVQGTYWHPEDAYVEAQEQEKTVTVKLPCLVGNVRKFWDFMDLPDEVKKQEADEYAKSCKPVFKHLDLVTLADSCTTQKRPLFALQMLLDVSQTGQVAFTSDDWMWIEHDDVPRGLPCDLFMDTAFKRPENRFRGDNNALAIVAYDRHGRHIVCDGGYSNAWGETEVFLEAARLIRTWKPRRFFCEFKQEGDITTHWRRFCFENGIYLIKITPLKKAGQANKHGRIMGLQGEFDSGRLVLVKNTPICLAMAEEAKTYDKITGCGTKDDALDCVAQSYDPAVGEQAGWYTEAEGPGGQRGNDYQRWLDEVAASMP